MLLSNKYEEELLKQINLRVIEMNSDDNSHYMLYKVLGIKEQEGKDIDLFQNKGRFLYKYAGAFLEEATVICIKYQYPNAGPISISNTLGVRPKKFGVDCFVAEKNHAIEIKWRDATTDGDHITKEHTRIRAISKAGFVPVRIMFYYPNRTQAQRIQETLRTLYSASDINGIYCSGEQAWKFVHEYTGVDLFKVLSQIADEKSA